MKTVKILVPSTLPLTAISLFELWKGISQIPLQDLTNGSAKKRR